MELFHILTLVTMVTSASDASSPWKSQEISLKTWKKINALKVNSLLISVNINGTHLSISQGEKSIYNFKTEDEEGGVHVLALHSLTGAVMMARRFRTYQPAEGKNLRSCLEALQPGRVVIIVGIPEFLSYLSLEGVASLKSLGAQMLPYVSTGEPWAMVSITGSTLTSDPSRSKIIGEAVATREQGRSARNLFLQVALPKEMRGRGCWWQDLKELRDQNAFCSLYEGYQDLCGCEDPFIPARQPIPPPITMAEDIPVVIVTANKPFYLYRLLKNLGDVPGSGETKVLVVVDGPNEETLHLAKVFGVEVMVHEPQGKPGENTRTNMNIAFALYSVFSRWPHVDKAILLEDDLILSPDILSFFHQSAWLLTHDPTLFLVNAFGQNSYPSTSCDPRTLLRADMYPQYGWMTSRRWVTQVLTEWVPEGGGRDWDWWIYTEGVRHGLQAIVPEVSRTAHAGAAGAHVTGWEQHQYFDSRLMNHRPLVTLRNIERLLAANYSKYFEDEIRRATKLHLQVHPCHAFILPKDEPGPFVLYLGVASRADGYNGFFLLQACLGTDEQEVKEIYEGVIRLRVRPYVHDHILETQQDRGPESRDPARNVLERAKSRSRGCEKEARVVYLVGCPLSKYCKYSSGTSDWIIPNERFVKEADKVASERKMAGVLKTTRIRLAPKTAKEEFDLTNFKDLSRGGRELERVKRRKNKPYFNK